MSRSADARSAWKSYAAILALGASLPLQTSAQAEPVRTRSMWMARKLSGGLDI